MATDVTSAFSLADALGQGGKLASSSFGLSSIDNLVNMGLTLFTPKPPKPTDLKLDRYNTDLNINDRMTETNNMVGNYSKSLAGMGLGAGAEAAARMGMGVNATTERNKLYAEKENYANSMENQNVDLSNKELAFNNQLANGYQDALYQHKLAKFGAVSANMSDLASGGMQAIKTGMDFNSDLNKAMMIAKANPEVAANMLDIPMFATLAQKNPAYREGIKQAIINGRRGDKAAQYNKMFPDDLIDETWASYAKGYVAPIQENIQDGRLIAPSDNLEYANPDSLAIPNLQNNFNTLLPQSNVESNKIMSLMTPEEQQLYNTDSNYKLYIDQMGETGIKIWRDKNLKQ